MLAQYVRRRDTMLSGLAAIPGLAISGPEGAFYAFPRVRALYARKAVSGSVELCRRLLEEARIATVPGDAFGDDDCIRLSFATSVERITEGMRRFQEWAR